ncbi:MAG: hypothetical protein FP810_18465 [Desulfocapsa sp.]|nr:hypothetical protein [Desulfocapsa sp.]MBU4108137.1 hypothetical protein [Pseudomonadota bacterium]MCG2744274.1 hypothetical protein [Desulfobacteraceae bacterium]
MTTITLTDSTTTITLPDDTLWRDELDWSPVDQSIEYMLSGALDIQGGTRLAGRPITLGGDESSSWLARVTILALMTWAGIAGQSLTLDYHGRIFTVMFRHQDAPAVDAKAVLEQVPPADEDWYWFTIKLMAV